MFMKCEKIDTLWAHVYGVYMFFWPADIWATACDALTAKDCGANK